MDGKETIKCQCQSLHYKKKMKFSTRDFLCKCDQIRSILWIWSHLLKKYLMENHFLCSIFSQKDPSQIFDKVLNTILMVTD